MICKNKTLKKKRMLDLMTKRKMSPKKKQIIKTYGKDMIAEMYLDLINLAEIKNKSNLMNYNVNRRKSNEINSNEFDDPNFTFVDKSMFNQTQTLKSPKNQVKNLAQSHGKTLFKDLKNSSFMENKYRSRSVRRKHSKGNSRQNNTHDPKVFSRYLMNDLV